MMHGVGGRDTSGGGVLLADDEVLSPFRIIGFFGKAPFLATFYGF